MGNLTLADTLLNGPLHDNHMDFVRSEPVEAMEVEIPC